MPNLRLEHSGNMSITSAEITSAGTLNVSYEPNNTGSVTGFTFTLPDTEFVCGGTYTITGTPIYNGTVLTENFVVSGTDAAGVKRSDTCALNQKYDTNLFTLRYKSETATSTYLAEITREDWHSNYVELDVAINGTDSFYITIGWRNNNDTATEYFSTCLINVTPPEPVPATSLTINVPSEIIISGLATATYTPTVATVNLVYSSSDTSKATIDPHSGVITVLEDGVVTFCVEDTISSLSDCKSAIVYATHPGPDTGTVIDSISIIVQDSITGTGYASAVYTPAYAAVDLHYSSEAPGIASIDETTGEIFVYQNGVVTLCVTDIISGLSDCKTINVRVDQRNLYFTIFVTGQGDLHWDPTSYYVQNCQYRKNYGEWVSDETGFFGPTGVTLEAEPGDLFEFKCNYKNNTRGDGIGSNLFSGTTCGFITYGNIMSLAYGDDYRNQKTLVNDYQFAHMFEGCTGLTDAEKLFLPATALTPNCYSFMFSGCNNLITVPELPATDLTNKNWCYSNMFADCTSLQDAPVLPATALCQSCYSEMFSGCTSLYSAPALPATTLDVMCYRGMFKGCTGLRNAPVLPATELRQECYQEMFAGCINIYSAPELPATALTSDCYESMFSGCTSLRYVKSLARGYLMPYYGLTNWLAGVSPTGIFIKNPAAGISETGGTREYERGVSGIPVNWSVEDAT